MNQFRARVTLTLVLPFLILTMGFGPLAVAGDDLPSRLATHFELSGAPAGSMTVVGFVVMTLALTMPAVACLVVLGLRRRPLPPFVGPMVGFLAAYLGLLGAAISLWTISTQRHLDDWRTAEGPGAWLIPIIGAPFVAGVVAGWSAAALPTDESRDDARLTALGDRPTPADVGVDPHAAWTSTLSIRLQMVAGVAAMAVGLLLSITVSWLLGLTPLLVGGVSVWLSTILVTADDTGLVVAYGPWRWPRTTIPIGRIERADAIDGRPLAWGGWGYRGSLRLIGRAAVVLRAGPGVRLTLTDRNLFVVTVDEPEMAAARLNGALTV